MRFVYDPSGIAQLEFGSADDFNAWVHDRTERVRREFPGSIREVGELGPLVIARWAIDTPRLIIDELAVELEDLVGLRFGLDGELPIAQVESLDRDTGIVHQWNVAPRAVFDRADAGPAAIAPPRDPAAELVAFGKAYVALGRSRQFTIAHDGTAPRFSGFCPVCDGVLRTTAARVHEHDTGRTLWGERCVSCARSSLVWKAEWQHRCSARAS